MPPINLLEKLNNKPKGFKMNFIKAFALAIWANHRKKFLAFVFGLLFAVFSLVSGIPLQDIKDAAKEAAGAPAVVAPMAVPVLTAPPAIVPAPKVEKK